MNDYFKSLDTMLDEYVERDRERTNQFVPWLNPQLHRDHEVRAMFLGFLRDDLSTDDNR